jgi:DNA-binding XRE family transcriptional regulator
LPETPLPSCEPFTKVLNLANDDSVVTERLATYLRYIAGNVRAWRIRRGLTQEALAEIADLDLRFIQRIERGLTNLSMAVLVALADALDVAPQALLRAAKMSPSRPGRPRKVTRLASRSGRTVGQRAQH